MCDRDEDAAMELADAIDVLRAYVDENGTEALAQAVAVALDALEDGPDPEMVGEMSDQLDGLDAVAHEAADAWRILPPDQRSPQTVGPRAAAAFDALVDHYTGAT